MINHIFWLKILCSSSRSIKHAIGVGCECVCVGVWVVCVVADWWFCCDGVLLPVRSGAWLGLGSLVKSVWMRLQVSAVLLFHSQISCLQKCIHHELHCDKIDKLLWAGSYCVCTFPHWPWECSGLTEMNEPFLEINGLCFFIIQIFKQWTIDMIKETLVQDNAARLTFKRFLGYSLLCFEFPSIQTIPRLTHGDKQPFNCLN